MTAKSFARIALETMGTRTDSLDDRTVNEAFRQLVKFLIEDFQKRARHDADLYNKVEANYVDEAWQNDNNPIDHDCAACKHYQPGGYACKRVTGKISPEGSCDLWSGFEPHDRGDSSEPTRKVIGWNGLKIGITHEAGRDVRFNQPLRDVSYGRIYRSYGQAEDGKSIDVWVGPHLKDEDGEMNPTAYWYQQLNPEDGSPDERKLVIGFFDRAGAKTAIQQTMPGYLRESMFGGLYPVNDDDLMSYRRDSREDFLNGNFSSIVHTDSCDCGCAECKAKDRKKRQQKKKKIDPAPLEEIEGEVQREEFAPKSFVGDANSPERPGFVYVPQSGDRDAYWRRDPRQRRESPIQRKLNFPEGIHTRYVGGQRQLVSQGRFQFSSLSPGDIDDIESWTPEAGGLPSKSFLRQLWSSKDAAGLLLSGIQEMRAGYDGQDHRAESALNASLNVLDRVDDIAYRSGYENPPEPGELGNLVHSLRVLRSKDGTIQSYAIVSASQKDRNKPPSLEILGATPAPQNLSKRRIWRNATAYLGPDEITRLQYYREDHPPEKGSSSAMLESLVRESQSLGFEGRIHFATTGNRDREQFFRAAGFQSDPEDQEGHLVLTSERAQKFLRMRAWVAGHRDASTIEEAQQFQDALDLLEEEGDGLLINPVDPFFEENPQPIIGFTPVTQQDSDPSQPQRPGFVWVPQSGDREGYWRRDPRRRRAIELPPTIAGRFTPTRPYAVEGGRMTYAGLTRSEQQDLYSIAQGDSDQIHPMSFTAQIGTAQFLADSLHKHVDKLNSREAEVLENSKNMLDGLSSYAVYAEADTYQALGNPKAGLRALRGKNGFIQSYSAVSVGRSVTDGGKLALSVNTMVTAPWNLSRNGIWQPIADADPQVQAMMPRLMQFRQSGSSSAMLEGLIKESQALGMEGRIVCSPVATNRPLFSRAGFRYPNGQPYRPQDDDELEGGASIPMELSPERARKFLEMRNRTQGRTDAMTDDEAWLWQQELDALEEDLGGMMVIDRSAVSTPTFSSPTMPLLINPPGFSGDSEEGGEGFPSFFHWDGARIWVTDETVQGGGYWRFDPRAGNREDVQKLVKRGFVKQEAFSKLSRSGEVTGDPLHINTAFFVTDGRREFLYKEDKGNLIDSLAAPREVLCAQVAQSARVPNNQVWVVPKQVTSDFKIKNTAGTLHSLVPGKNFEFSRNDEDFQSPSGGSYYDLYPSEWSQRVLSHPDLAKIHALDLFTGNNDRHDNNLMFDPARNRFYSIDMGRTFINLNNLAKTQRELKLYASMGGVSTEEQRKNLEVFNQTLQNLHQRNSPESMKARMRFFAYGAYSKNPSRDYIALLDSNDDAIDTLHQNTGKLIMTLDDIRSRYR